MEFANKLLEKVGKEYLSYSSIKYARQDMRLWEMYMAGQLKKESDALQFGSLYDCLLFEEDKFDERFVVFNDLDIVQEIGGKNPRATKEYRLWKSELMDQVGTRTLCSVDDHTMAIDMITRLEECGLRETYLMGEFQVEFNAFIGDVPVRGFLDVKGDHFITDSKSTKSINGFKYDIFSFGYDIQAYIYTSIFPNRDYFWVAQEKSYPYLPALVRASEETINSGQYKFEDAVRRINNYLHSNESTNMYFAEFIV